MNLRIKEVRTNLARVLKDLRRTRSTSVRLIDDLRATLQTAKEKQYLVWHQHCLDFQRQDGGLSPSAPEVP